MTIYSGATGLVNGWQDTGNSGAGEDNASSSAVPSDGENCISATITNAYGGIDFLHAPTNDASFGSISFWLNGGPSGGQNLEMYGILGLANGVQAPQSARYFLNAPASNTWQHYTVPLASLGVANVTNLAGFAIQDCADGSEPVFYLDDVQLLSSAAPAPPPPQLTVNAGQPIRTADPRWFGIGTPIWDEYLTNTPQTLNFLTNMGAQALRFPGGSAADQFHWFDNVNDAGKAPFQYGPSLSNFIQLVTNLNAQTMITVNYGSGTPSEAAAWVAYLNATTNNLQYLGVDSSGVNWQTAGYWASLRAAAPLAGDDGRNFLRISHPEPLGFKYWEIGNEVFGYWETDTNFVPHDPYTYAVRAQQYIWLMKAVDPTIKIGVVAIPGVSNFINNANHPAVDPVTHQIDYGWTPVMLATLAGLGVTPDMAITHCYPENPTFENDWLLLSGVTSGWAANAADLRSQINDFLGAKGTNVELVCTENNSDVAQPGKQSVSLVNGLYKADTLGQMMQTEFKGLFWHDFRDGAIEYDGNMSPNLYGWRLYGDFGVATLTNGATAYTNLYPTYYTSELIRRFAQGGDTVVAAASDYSLLSVYAVRRQNGNLTLLAINKDPLNTNTAQLSLAGFTPASSMTVYSYGIPQDFAAQISGPQNTQDIQTNISGTGTNFSYSFPPYSATVMVLAPASSTRPSMTTVASSQNPAQAGSGVTFTATVSGSGGTPTGYVVFNHGTTNLGIGTLNGSGMANLTIATLSVGGSTNSITAVYSGDGAFAGSTSSNLSQVFTNKTAVSTNGLSASWLLNEGSGTNVADSSGNGNTGTLNYSPLWVSGLNGSNALEFPGNFVALEFPGQPAPSAAFVSAPDSITLADQGIGSNITICAWVKRSYDSIGNYSAVLAKDTPFDTFPYHRNYELLFDTENHILFIYRNGVGKDWEIYSSSNTYADYASWHFYCVTYEYGTATNFTLYVDGAPVSGSWISGNGSDAPASTSGGPLMIGIDGTGTSSYGSVYEGISIYSILLSKPQVLAHYISGISTGIASTTALASSPNPASAGSVVTYTATVSGSGGTPTGTVVFFDGNNILGTEALNSSGMASVTTNALSDSGSPHSIIAIYEGDGVFAGSSSSVLSQIFAFSPSTNTLSSSTNPAWAGSVVTFTATVSGSNGPPTGTVVFFDGTNILGTNTLNTSGVASFSTSTLSASGSPHSITAVYGGDSTFIGTNSSVLSQIINLRPSTNSISSSQNPAWVGGAVTFTVMVSGSFGTPTGMVVFYDGTNNMGSGALNSSGVASLTNSALSASGSPHSMTAVYGGDNTFGNSTSSVLSQIIALRPSTNTISSSQNPALVGGVVTFTATVSGSGGTPTGTVVFYDGTNNLGSGVLNSNGMAGISTSTLSAGASPHSIAAVYGGDSQFSNSTSSVLSQAIHLRPSTNAIISSQNPAWVGGIVTFTATVSGSNGTPTGTVVFYDGTNNLGSSALNSGTTSFSTGTLSVGGSPHSITAVYGGDSTFSNSTSSVLLQTITLRPSTNTISSSQNPASAGSVVTFTATVGGSNGIPTGTVVFHDGTNSLGSGTLNGSGVASFSTGALSAGGSPHSMTAVYGGDGTFSNSTSSALTQIINFRPSTNTIISSQNPASAGSVVTFTAAVSGSGATPTGTVAFYDGTNNLGSGTLNGSGMASLSTSALSASGSPHSIAAAYGGDNLFSNSISGALSQVIALRPSTNTLRSSQNPSAAGIPVTFTATVSGNGGTPTGTAVFYDGTNNLGSGTLNGSGVASLTTSALSVSGSPHSMSAVYGGDAMFSNSTSSVLSQFIAYRPSTNTISSSQNPASAGSAVTFTATVSGSNGTPTGTVVFYDGTNNLGSGTLNGSGVASVAASALSVSGSPHSITAVYGGDSTFIGSTSGTLLQIIHFATSTTAISSSPNPSAAGSAVTFTATVSGSGGTPTGTVVFHDGTNNLGSGTLNSSGVASLSTSALSVSGSPHSITAAYGGDSTFSNSASSALSQVIVLHSSTNTITSSQNPASAGSVVTFTATVSGSGGTPSGTVVFYDGTNNLGGAALTSGVAAISTSALSVGGSPHSITAVYSGDSMFGGGASGVLSQVINFAPSTNTISSSQNPAAARSTVTFTATVSGSSGTPTGTVSFYDGTNNLGSTALNSGMASLGSAALSVGGSPHAITAVYSGDSKYSGSTSGALSQVITLAPSTTAISSSQNPAASGSVVEFAATVSGSGGTPTGTVVFYDGTNSLGSATLNSSGVAATSTTALSVNGSPHSITAVYGGDSAFSNSTSSALSQIITNSTAGAATNGLSASWAFNEGSGTTVADSSGNGNTGMLNNYNSPQWVPGRAGSSALEFPGPFDAVSAYVSVPDSITLADQGIGSNITICAWVQRSPASLGNYCSVVAKDILYDSPPYHRNYEMIFDRDNHLLFVFMNSTGTSWEMYSSAAPFTDTANWHFYCVAYTYGIASSCVLYVDGAAVPGGWIAGNGSDAPASTSGAPLLIGTDGTGSASDGSIYEQIGIYNVALSAPRVLALFNGGNSIGIASTTAVASSQNPAVAGAVLTFAATVSGSGGTPTGTVVFYDGTNNLGSATLNNSGMASVSTGALSLSGSPHSITASYEGDNTFAASISSVLWQIITVSSGMVSIPLVNPSFEYPAGAQGTVAGAPWGWIASDGNPYGVYNPPDWFYANEVNDVLPSPAQGSQVLFIQGGNYLAQFLTNTLAPNQTYTFSGAIGNRGDGNGLLDSDDDYVCILAGGVFIAYNWDLPHPAPGTFLPWAITYTTGAAGFPSGTLEIRLGQNGVGQVHYDNITLTSASTIVQDPPVIIAQPTNQTVLAGSSPAFTVAAAGSVPLGYEWYVACTNLLQSGTNNTLTLPPVLASNAGSYSVVVTNAYGSVTSAVAALVVNVPLTAPQIMADSSGFGFSSGQFGFNLSGAFGQTIIVDGSTNLVDWTPLFTNTVGGSPFSFRDPASSGARWRFYRARLP